jgi:hypothetical protein
MEDPRHRRDRAAAVEVRAERAELQPVGVTERTA